VILTIDVTVTGPDEVMTGSVAVTVNEPPADASPAQAAEDPNLLMRRRAQQMQGGMSRA
jgi:hypothetical protein